VNLASALLQSKHAHNRTGCFARHVQAGARDAGANRVSFFAATQRFPTVPEFVPYSTSDQKQPFRARLSVNDPIDADPPVPRPLWPVARPKADRRLSAKPVVRFAPNAVNHGDGETLGSRHPTRSAAPATMLRSSLRPPQQLALRVADVQKHPVSRKSGVRYFEILQSASVLAVRRRPAAPWRDHGQCAGKSPDRGAGDQSGR
jgi:hypothetical protein